MSDVQRFRVTFDGDVATIQLGDSVGWDCPHNFPYLETLPVISVEYGAQVPTRIHVDTSSRLQCALAERLFGSELVAYMLAVKPAGSFVIAESESSNLYLTFQPLLHEYDALRKEGFDFVEYNHHLDY